MQLEVVLGQVEHPVEQTLGPPDNVLDGIVGHQEEVELGPHLLEGFGQLEVAVVVERRQQLGIGLVEVSAQLRQLHLRASVEAVAHHAGLDVVVEQRGDDGVLATRRDDDVIDELVVVASHRQQARAQVVLLGRREPIDNQQFEVGSGLVGDLLVVLRRLFGRFVILELAKDVPQVPPAVVVVLEQARDAIDTELERLRPTSLQSRAQVPDRTAARERPVALHFLEHLQGVRDGLAANPRVFDALFLRRQRQLRDRHLELVPGVGAELRSVVVGAEVLFSEELSPLSDGHPFSVPLEARRRAAVRLLERPERVQIVIRRRGVPVDREANVAVAEALERLAQSAQAPLPGCGARDRGRSRSESSLRNDRPGAARRRRARR